MIEYKRLTDALNDLYRDTVKKLGFDGYVSFWISNFPHVRDNYIYLRPEDNAISETIVSTLKKHKLIKHDDLQDGTYNIYVQDLLALKDDDANLIVAKCVDACVAIVLQHEEKVIPARLVLAEFEKQFSDFFSMNFVVDDFKDLNNISVRLLMRKKNDYWMLHRAETLLSMLEYCGVQFPKDKNYLLREPAGVKFPLSLLSPEQLMALVAKSKEVQLFYVNDEFNGNPLIQFLINNSSNKTALFFDIPIFKPIPKDVKEAVVDAFKKNKYVTFIGKQVIDYCFGYGGSYVFAQKDNVVKIALEENKKNNENKPQEEKSESQAFSALQSINWKSFVDENKFPNLPEKLMDAVCQDFEFLKEAFSNPKLIPLIASKSNIEKIYQTHKKNDQFESLTRWIDIRLTLLFHFYKQPNELVDPDLQRIFYSQFRSCIPFVLPVNYERSYLLFRESYSNSYDFFRHFFRFGEWVPREEKEEVNKKTSNVFEDAPSSIEQWLSSLENENPFDILNLQSSASEEDIKKAYREKAKEFHPDKAPGDKAAAEKKFQQINSAYHCLENDEGKNYFIRKKIPSRTFTR